MGIRKVSYGSTRRCDECGRPIRTARRHSPLGKVLRSVAGHQDAWALCPDCEAGQTVRDEGARRETEQAQMDPEAFRIWWSLVSAKPEARRDAILPDATFEDVIRAACEYQGLDG